MSDRIEVEPQPARRPASEPVATGSSPPLEPLEVQEASDDQNYPTGPKSYAVTAALLLVLLPAGLDNSIVSTAVPTITDHFKTTTDIGWYLSAYRLSSCSFLFMFGKLYTVMSIKVVFLTSLAIFEFGSLLCTVAPTSHALVLGRAVAGLGCSGLLNGVFTIITQSFPLRRRPLIGGVSGAVEGLASVAAPLLGGVLTDKLSWRACFGINLPLGAVAGAIIFFSFENPQPNPDIELPFREKLKKLDLPSTAIFLPSICCLLLALQWGGTTYGWSDARIIVLLITFAVSLTAFGWLQHRRQDNATLPPRILKQRSILSGAWFAGCCNASLGVVEYYIVIYFQAVRGYSATRSGILLLPAIGGLCVACLCAGAATTALGYYTPLMFLATVLGAVAAGLLTTLTVTADLASILCYTGLLGFGLGMGIQAPQFAAQTVLDPKEISIGIAIVAFGQGIGPAIMVTAAQSIFQSRLKTDLSQWAAAEGVNATASIENMGLSDLRHEFGGDSLKKALLGYDKAVTQTMYLPVALTCLALLGAAGMEWKSVKQKKT